MQRMGRIFAYTVAVIGLLCYFADAQLTPEKAKDDAEDFDPKTTTRVALGNSSGTAGTSVVVPLYFTPSSGVSVGHLKLEITFVSANMKFSKFDGGVGAEMANVDLKTNLRAEKNDMGVENSTLTIEATSPESAKSGLPAGLLAYVTMKISETGGPAKIALRMSAEAEETGTRKPVKNLKSFDAEVEVFPPGTEPMVPCFFFSH